MTGFSDDTTFYESLINFVSLIGDLLIHRIFEIQDSSELVPDRPVLTVRELFRKSEFYFVNLDNSCAEYPKLTAPNLKFLPGASVGKVKPLPKDLEEFVEESGEPGTIVATFGTLEHTKTLYLPNMIDRLFQTFSKLEQRIIFVANPVTDRKVPENVLISDWIPQNDLLAHPKVKLFITHGGSNGQLEAIHHGVPMIAMGVDYDQIYNGKKVEDKEFGKYLSAKYFTSNELYDAIQEVLHNGTFKQNLMKCHEIKSSLPQAKDIVTFWVNHILKFGGSHLRLKSTDVPLYKLLMLDVLLFICCIVIVVFVLLVVICKCVFKICKRTLSKKKQD